MILPIFPPGALDASVVTTVWIGIFVVAVLNLRYGTTMSGLVVPGYLVPLLLVKPVSAVIVVIEGLLAYGCALVFAESLMKRLGLGEMFGRDRFFAIMLFSVLVRVLADGWALPALGEWLSANGYAFDYRYSLHSFGLVIVALVANMMWNGGMAIGLRSLAIYLVLTVLIVRYGLMVFTNFNIGNLAFMYEDVASNILASPKAYMILLTTAYFASRFNLKYGWDFNGIIIPALIALQWYQPLKLLATLVESFVILFASGWLLQLPFFARRNMEGARLLVLFFNVGFFYKIILGYLVATLNPGLKTSDLYAFGYLLSTLMAIKMYQKGITIRLTRTTLQTSIMAWLLASGVGYFLNVQFARQLAINQAAPVASESRRSDEPLAETLQRLRAELYQSDQPGGGLQPSRVQQEVFEDSLRALRQLKKPFSAQALDPIAEQLARIDYGLSVVGEQHVVLHDRVPARGFGLFVVNLKPARRYVIEVPVAVEQGEVAEAAIWMYATDTPRAMALCGARRMRQRDGSTDVLRNSRSLFQRFHHVFAADGAMQLRAAPETRRLLDAGQKPLSRLYVKKTPPNDLDLERLRTSIGAVAVEWSSPRDVNRQRERSHGHFAELLLNRDGIRRLVAHGVGSTAPATLQSELRIDGYLRQWLDQSGHRFAQANSNTLVKADLGSMVFIAEELLKPLHRLARDPATENYLIAQAAIETKTIPPAVDANAASTPAAANESTANAAVASNEVAAEAARIAQLAHAVGYRLILYRHRSSARHYWILAEVENETQRLPRHWGLLLLKIGKARDIHVQVPHPADESQTLVTGASLFERLDARSLMIAGAHRHANDDGSADVTSSAFPLSLFNLHHQVLVRNPETPQPLFVQLRGHSGDKAMPADVVLDVWEGRTRVQEESLRAVESALAVDGAYLRWVDGSPDLAPFAASVNAQTQGLSLLPAARVVTAWVNAPLRQAYRSQALQGADALRAKALGIPVEVRELGEWLRAFPPQRARATRPELQVLLEQYASSFDTMALVRARQLLPELQWRVLLDPSSGQSFLDLRDANGGWVGIANLHPRRLKAARTISPVAAPDVSAFRAQGEQWLRLETKP